MTRYFLAVDLPAWLRESLHEHQAVLAERGFVHGRLVSKDQLHVTVAFFGSLSNEELATLRDSVVALSTPRFSARVSGLELVGRRMVWAVLSPQEPWQELRDEVKRVATNYSPKRAVMHPHVTLMRIKRVVDEQALRRFLSCLEVSAQLFRVSTVSLYSSRLTAQGPVYSRVASYALG